MAATLHCYHLAALLQPEESPSAASAACRRALDAGAQSGPQHASGNPAGGQRAGYGERRHFAGDGRHAEPAGARRTGAAAGRAKRKKPLLLPDAWSNPAYLHFALKTLLATLLCYVFYTAADWQGIHTIMLSCVIVAQPGLGATLQKTWLRIGGALLATLLALLMIVFIQPHTESLVGLLAMTLPVMALSAWIAAGSERIAYAGIQIGFTFRWRFSAGLAR
jgi:multidrug resistance protein MdtO